MNKETKNKILKISIIILCFIAIILAIYLPLQFSGVLQKIDSAEELKEIILSGGVYSYLIFFCIQFLQTTLLPIPAMITTIAGSLVFGVWVTFLLSFLAVMLGSVVSFLLGRKVGRRLAYWVAGEESTIKWQEKLEKGKYVFFLMMLFPVFPDDILCLIVGAVTTMSWKFFLITNLLTRPISIITTCLFGSGSIIPFNAIGIPIWIVLILIMALLFYLSIKYQAQIENFITKISDKLTKKKTNRQIIDENTKTQSDNNTKNNTNP